MSGEILNPTTPLIATKMPVRTLIAQTYRRGFSALPGLVRFLLLPLVALTVVEAAASRWAGNVPTWIDVAALETVTLLAETVILLQLTVISYRYFMLGPADVRGIHIDEFPTGSRAMLGLGGRICHWYGCIGSDRNRNLVRRR